jgi:hypothetical protein
MTQRLKGHRLEQLRILKEAGAVSRETAIATLANPDLRPVTLAAMVGERLVENAYLPFNGDPKRRLSHYWLTAKGAAAA